MCHLLRYEEKVSLDTDNFTERQEVEAVYTVSPQFFIHVRLFLKHYVDCVDIVIDFMSY